ncbi:MAG: UDP-3-O-(3-hydroxymyristoyl)glucosamine N-acyltransferase [Fibromonadaceae bacterium]|jgi:UDP-3-O-[3-hydroxymyristoyl] glucosamine N-acyltransferase|nr:UDP-3-O-(3-hydroxymyristoyl)glucosamine N-acyltransferase [Fibromonadaceae bacterium]
MLTFAQIAELTNALLEPGTAQGMVQKCATLAFATQSDISFCVEQAAYGAARKTKAAMVFVPKNFSGWVGEAQVLARVENPYKAIIDCAKILNKKEFSPSKIHPTAQISPNAQVLGSVGANSIVGAFCSVPMGASIGDNCVLESNVSLYPNVEIGNGTILHSGVVIGSRGFGFYKSNNEQPAVPHFGGVVIGENCEIGPNSVIAAGFLEATKLGNFCKLDSFVQIAHNCIVGNNATFCSQSGLAGSVTVEDNVTLAGGAQVAGHLTLGQGCIIAAKAGVTKSIKAKTTVAGFPAIPIEQWRKKVQCSLR